MLTIINAVELSADYLNKKGIESPRINAELLLAHILNCKRMDLYLKFDQPLREEETAKYREAIKRRGLREPLQYITGSVEFYGLEFMVNEDVLIPRQETEILVEAIISKVDKLNEIRILEIGTGSGNIAISLSKNLPNSLVHSIDISEKAINVATKNAEIHNHNGRLTFEVSDFNDYSIDNDLKYDVIVSNPPYISLHEYSDLDIELKNHEPQNALTDENDGFSFYELISSKANNILKQNRLIFFEVGQNQSEKVRAIMKKNGFAKIEVIKDYLEIDRVVIGELK